MCISLKPLRIFTFGFSRKITSKKLFGASILFPKIYFFLIKKKLIFCNKTKITYFQVFLHISSKIGGILQFRFFWSESVKNTMKLRIIAWNFLWQTNALTYRSCKSALSQSPRRLSAKKTCHGLCPGIAILSGKSSQPLYILENKNVWTPFVASCDVMFHNPSHFTGLFFQLRKLATDYALAIQYCLVKALNPHKYMKIKMYALSSAFPVEWFFQKKNTNFFFHR